MCHRLAWMLVSGVLARRRSLSFDGKWFVILRGYGMLLRILWVMVQLKSECWYEIGVWWQMLHSSVMLGIYLAI